MEIFPSLKLKLSLDPCRRSVHREQLYNRDCGQTRASEKAHQNKGEFTRSFQNHFCHGAFDHTCFNLFKSLQKSEQLLDEYRKKRKQAESNIETPVEVRM